MKIVMLIPEIVNKGPEIVVKDIISYYNQKDIEFIIVSLRKNLPENIKLFEGYKIYEIDTGKVPLKFNKLKKIIDEINPDIIHCHGFWPTVLSGFALKNYKILTTLHNNPNEDFYYKYGKVIGFFMTKTMLFFQKRVELNIAISNYIENIHKKMGLKNIITIYNGIPNINYLNPTNNINNKKLKLITVSSLIERKNVEFLIKVINELNKHISNVELSIIGDGNEKENLINLVKLFKLETKVKFLGNLSREKVYENLNKSDIFLFSSLSEGFGLVIAEALSLKVPVVTNNIPVMKEIIVNKKNGIICDLKVDDYIQAILEINNNKEEYIKNTQIYFNKNFLASNMSKNYIEVYKKFSIREEK